MITSSVSFHLIWGFRHLQYELDALLGLDVTPFEEYSDLYISSFTFLHNPQPTWCETVVKLWKPFCVSNLGTGYKWLLTIPPWHPLIPSEKCLTTSQHPLHTERDVRNYTCPAGVIKNINGTEFTNASFNEGEK